MYHLYSSQYLYYNIIITKHIVLPINKLTLNINKHVIFNISQCDNIIYVKYINFDLLPRI